MLLVNVHQLNVVLADPVAVGALKDNVDDIWRVFGLEREDVVGLSRAEHLLQRCEVDTESDVPVASERRERLGFEHHRNEGNM